MKPIGVETQEERDFRILGPFEVRRGGERVQLRGERQQALLAILLLHANEPLSTDRLIDELWGDDAPDTAAKMIQNNVWQLRKLLEPEAALRAREPQVLVTRGRGYELRIDPDDLDARRFERLAEEGARALADGAPDAAAAVLRDALGLWRGPVLAELAHEPFAEAEIARLEQLRLAAVEDRIEADLALGSSADLVAELEALLARHPLRERLRGQLMLALYRSGRQADALGVYQRTRRLLVDELGIEPSPALQRLERAILRQEPSLELPRPRDDDGSPAPAPAREVRKTVSVVVAEVALLGPRRDPEAARGPLSRALARVSDLLAARGATVQKALSGATAGIFGIPLVLEDDALRAVRAAADLQAALHELNDELEREFGVRVALRAAVDTATVLAGAEGAVTGDAVELAARIAQATGWGDVLIGDATRRVVAGSVEVERVELPAAHPAADAAEAWRLVELVPGAPAIARRLDAPLVGRARELAELRHAFERVVRERMPYLFTVLGPPGIGKSRLALELAASLESESRVLVGRCLPRGESTALWPLAEIVRQAGCGDAIALADSTIPTEETFSAARKLFEALAREEPVVLVFDDLHWAEPTLLDLVEHLAEWARDAPVLVVCLARPELLEERPSWAGGKLNATSILLEPLSEPESEALLAELAGDAELPREVLVQIAEVAEGYPLFLEQMLAMVREGGFAPGAVAIPPTIHALLGARLDRLPPDERGVLEVAAVQGKDFARDALVDLLPEDERGSADASLQKLVRRELIRPAPSLLAQGEAFRFRHVLLRDAAYDAVPKSARGELHERFAAWLDRCAGDRGRELDEIVGHHLEQAYRYRVELGPPDERAHALAAAAGDRLAAAGRRAHARGDVRAAVTLLERAAALPAGAGRERVELHVELGEALRERGDFDHAAAVLAGAAAAADEPVLEAAARIARLRLQLQTDARVKTDELLEQATDAVAVFERVGDERRLAQAWELLAWVPWFRCRAASAESALARAIEHARRAGDSRTEAQGTHLLLGAAWFGPTPVPEAAALCEQVLSSGEQRRVIASALRALAGLRALEGDFAAARAAIAEDRAILADLGLRVTAASAAETYAIVELLAGNPAAAERELRAGYEILEQMGETRVSILAALLAEALHVQGRQEEALRFTETSERATPRDDLFGHVQWRAARAKVLARLGGLGEAESLAREAVRLAAETDFLVGHGDALSALADVLAHAARPQEAAVVLEDALRLYERKGSTVSAARSRAALRELVAGRG